MTSPTTNEDLAVSDIVYALAASPAFAADKTCFAARASGLYGSHDGGATWQPLYGSLKLSNPLPTSSVVVSPAYPADLNLFAASESGILRSFDGGKTWEIVLLPAPPPPLIVALAVSPNYSRDGVLLVGTAEDGVYHSADRGSRWVAWNFGLFDLNILCLAVSPDFAADETLYAGAESGVFQSTNGGRAWRELAFSPDLAPVLSLALSPDYSFEKESGVLFAGTESHGLWRSPDHGLTWVRVGADAIPADTNAVLLSAHYPTCPDLLVLTSTALLLSRNDGATWHDITPDAGEARGLTCVAAPLGLDPGAPLLAGLDDGTVLCLSLPAAGDD